MSEVKEQAYGNVIAKGSNWTIYKRGNESRFTYNYVLECKHANGLVTVKTYHSFSLAHGDAILFELSQKFATEQANAVCGNSGKKNEYGIVVYESKECTIYEKKSDDGKCFSYTLACNRGIVPIKTYNLFSDAIDGARFIYESNLDAPEQTNPVDMVNSPPHYTQGKIECIEAIRAALTAEEFRGFCKGNAMKYVFRERLKGGMEDIKKAEWYLAKMQEKTE